jgi:putative phosphoribosyl transferase
MGTVQENPALRDKRFVFRDRKDAGMQLGEFLRALTDLRDPVVCPIPAGGVPIGTGIARALRAPLALAVVRKIQIPGNTEAGFGAMSWDGKVFLNEELLRYLNLTDRETAAAIEKTRRNVQERIAVFTEGKPFPDLPGRCAILTDDGLASGYTMLAAIASVREHWPARLVVAVPTASAQSASRIAREVDTVVCLNIRTGPRFAVAEAYREWHDLDDDEVLSELEDIPDAPDRNR